MTKRTNTLKKNSKSSDKVKNKSLRKKEKSSKIKRNKSRVKNNTKKNISPCEKYLRSNKFKLYLEKSWEEKVKYWINIPRKDELKYKNMYKTAFKYIIKYCCENQLGVFNPSHPENPIFTDKDLPMLNKKPSKKSIDTMMSSNKKHFISMFTFLK